MSYLSLRFGMPLSFLVFISTAAAATEALPPLPLPEGPVLLTVKGEITETNGEGAARFDLAMLEELGVVTYETTTPWTVGKLQLEGVTLKAVLDRVGATGDLIFAEAFNDYSSEIPISDATEDGAVIAFRMNGKEMTLRDKGPLWVVYHYDKNPAYTSEVYLTRSIWQLDRLTVKHSPTRSEH